MIAYVRAIAGTNIQTVNSKPPLQNMATQKKCLNGEIVFLTGLSYKKACEVIQKATASKAGEFMVFAIESKDGENGWQLVGMVKKLQLAFLENPEAFTIEYDDGESA